MYRNKWTDYEISILRENYIYGIDHVTKLLPNHSQISIRKKAKFLGLKVVRLITEEIKNAVKESYSFSDVFRKLNKSKSGDSYKIIKRIIEENEIDISHFDPYKNSTRNLIRNEFPIEEHLKFGSIITSNHLKKKLYKYGLKQKVCEECGQDENWRGKKISLILDHINGISNDNRLENLRILCPNCNATLDTHCRGYKNNKEKLKKIREKVVKSKKVQPIKEKDEFGFSKKEKESQTNQRKVERPPYNDLLKMVEEIGYVATGKKYGVSDNTIRKWIRMYEKYGKDF